MNKVKQISKHGYTFDIAISLLKEDLPFAESLFEVFNQYELKTFLYPHNQPEIANKNGMDVFKKTFKEDARIVALLYRKGYGETPYTRIEHTAIQERYLLEGADFCVLIPLDGNKPVWYPSFQIYTSNKSSSKEVAELILHKLVDMGGDLKERTFESYIKEGMELLQKKREHYSALSTPESFSLLETEIKIVKTIFHEKHQFILNQNLPYNKIVYGLNNPDSFDNTIILEHIGITAFFTPSNTFYDGNSQTYTLNMSIFKAIENHRTNTGFDKEPLELSMFKINFYPDKTPGWSKIIEIIGGAENYKPYLIDYCNKGTHYDLDPIIISTRELINDWFRKFIKTVFDNNKL